MIVEVSNKQMNSMKNPWESILLSHYEGHMQLSDIQQLQTLNAIMKKQIITYPVKTIAVLGIAGGNGLEHIETDKIEKVFGIDINQNYLEACRNRYADLDSCLVLSKGDFTDRNFYLPQVGLVIANLFIEYVGIDLFKIKLNENRPSYLSCVIQSNIDGQLVSSSPYANSFLELEKLHSDVGKNSLVEAMKSIQMNLIYCEEILLPNKKMFTQLDFIDITK